MTRGVFRDALWDAVAKQHQELNGDISSERRGQAIHAEIAGIEAGKMKVAEYWKLVEAKAVELCDLLNSLLKLTTTTYQGVFTVGDILELPSLAGTSLDWELRTDKRRHVVVLYAEYLKLSAELCNMLSVEVNYTREEK